MKSKKKGKKRKWRIKKKFNKEDEENKINITINNIMKELNGKFENEKTINKKN